MAIEDETTQDVCPDEGKAAPTRLQASRAALEMAITLPIKPDMHRLSVPLRHALLKLDGITNLVDDDRNLFFQAQLVIAGLYGAIIQVLEGQQRLTLPEIRGVILIAAEAIATIIAAALEKDKTLQVSHGPSGGKRQAPRISNRA